MKTAKPILLLVICTCLALGLIIFCGRALPEAPDSNAATTSVPTTAVPAPEAPTYSYSSAAAQLLAAPDLAYSYTCTQTRTVGDEVFSEERTGTARYTDAHTENMEALVQEDVAYGSYSTHFTESYQSGRAYSQVRGASFVCDMSGDDFLVRQIPAVLLEESLYGQVTYSEDRLIIDFSEPSALESWADPTGRAEMVSATGHVHLNRDGSLSTAAYRAEYRLGTVIYKLDVSVEISGEAFDLEQPEYPEDCPVISDLEIPRYMLRTVDGVYSSLSTSAEYAEAVYVGALQESISKTGGYHTSGTGERFAANLQHQQIRSNSGGSYSTESQNNIFQDGQYRCTVNGGEAFIDASFTAERIRALCEDSVLSSMITLEHIAGAELTDEGDTLTVTFEGNTAFTEYFSGNIYAIFGFEISLDILADACQTNHATGYLTIDRNSGLPIAMGLSMDRTHVINGVSYALTYQRDQSLALASPDAQEHIHGK